MTETYKTAALIICIGIIIFLVVIIVVSGHARDVFVDFFYDTVEEDEFGNKKVKKSKNNSSEPVVTMATLIRKSDDRLRIVENDGTERFSGECYDLEFETQKGQKLKVQCSRDAYERIPFNETGSLTIKRNKLVKFKYYGETIFNE